jgi:hypothetical protein
MPSALFWGSRGANSERYVLSLRDLADMVTTDQTAAVVCPANVDDCEIKNPNLGHVWGLVWGGSC